MVEREGLVLEEVRGSCKYDLCLRVHWLKRQDFFKGFPKETQEDILYWLTISERMNDWVIFEVDTDEVVLLSTQENVEKKWNEWFADESCEEV